MVACPACGADSVDENGACPQCHLSASLFPAVREAASVTSDTDPTYLRTIGELLATVDLTRPPAAGTEPAHALLSRPGPTAEQGRIASTLPSRHAPTIAADLDLPPVPTGSAGLPELQHRLAEYFQVGRRLGVDFTDFTSRANSATLAGDVDSLEILAREMFVHLSSSIVEEYESLLGRRNELAQLLPTASADVELTAVRRSIGVGDLGGAQRRLAHVRDALAHIEEQWEVGQILVAEGEVMVTTIRELGGDASPATGPLEEGRTLFAEGRRADAERVLARGAVALWTVLEPRLMADLHRLRDRMMEERSAGVDIEPAVQELRAVSVELRKRNFVGTIGAYRRLKSVVEHSAPPGVEAVSGEPLAAEIRTSPPA
ncbi:MAG: hypothetical protein WA691_07050 [Thermoplasmata archaeon]